MVAGDKSDPVDVLVVGGGLAGYVCAIRAAQNGRSVTLVERERLGGLCLNRGCIPSKQLAVYAASKPNASDLRAFQQMRAAAIETLVQGVAGLLQSAGVTTVSGSAWFVGRTRVCVEVGEESVRYFDFKDMVIATGSCPTGDESLPVDNERIFEATAALEWEKVPASLLVAGDDYIAVELAVAFARLGSRVTLAPPSDRVLPGFDSDLSAAARRGAESLGVQIVPGAVAETHECVIVSSPRRPNIDSLQLAAAGIAPTAGYLAVDPQLRVDRHIFAIGDVTPGLALAHRAMAQGLVAGDVLGSKAAAMDARAVPRAVFAEPELASVGITEAEAREQGIEVNVARFPHGALGRAVLEAATAGFAKLVFARDGMALLGAHLAGPRSTELVNEMALAIEMGATAEDLALTMHVHPSFGEAALEAALLALGRPVHVRRTSR